ncbi:MAG: signal peptidase II [Bacteroidia bacterium]|jgi:signal peptidase II
MYYGEERSVIGDWFLLHFTENNGMAFGKELPGQWGKLALTFFRLIAVSGILYYLYIQIKKYKATVSTVVLVSLILAGALGNIIDSVFYGSWFTESMSNSIAAWSGDEPGYAGYFKGKVVDMFYFPVITGHYPNWFPYWGGDEFIFFRPIFNIADAAISIGVFSILLFKRDLFAKLDVNAQQVVEISEPTDESDATSSNVQPETDAPSERES